MANVFISYARGDKARVTQLAGALEAEGLSVWWDGDLAPGGRYRTIIAQELAAAESVIVVWTAASLQSDWVQDEAEEGRQRGVLIPVLLERLRPPAGFRQLQAADLSQWTGSPEHPEFRALAFAVRSLVQLAEAKRGAAVAQDVVQEPGAGLAPRATPGLSVAPPATPRASAPPASNRRGVGELLGRLVFSVWLWTTGAAGIAACCLIFGSLSRNQLPTTLLVTAIVSSPPAAAAVAAFAARRSGVGALARRVVAWIVTAMTGIAMAILFLLSSFADPPERLAEAAVVGLLTASVVFVLSAVAAIVGRRLSGHR